MERPKSILLKYPTFLSPQIFSKLNGEKIRGIVEDEFCVTIESQKFISDTPLSIGSEFVLSAGSYNALLHYQSDLDAYETFCKGKREAEKLRIEENQKQAIEKRKFSSAEFWAKHNNLPFEFSIDIKEVLSGLSANSWGDGTKKNTVFHVYLKSDFNSGRLNRKSGDFLCSQTTKGGNWSGSLGQKDNFDVDGVKFTPTCKKCLEILERFAVS